LQEAVRIKSDKDGIPYAKDRSDKFLLGIADNELDKLGADFVLNIDNKEAVKNVIKEKLTSDYSEFLSFLNKSNLITVDANNSLIINNNSLESRLGVGEELNSNLFRFLTGFKIAQTQIITLFAGDPAFYKDSVDFFKRVKQIYSPGTYIDTSAKFNGNVAEGSSNEISEYYKTIILSDSKKPYFQKDEIEQNLIKSGVDSTLAKEMADNFKQGKAVLLNVNNGAHWVLMTGWTGTNFLVNDPGYARTSYAPSEVMGSAIYIRPATGC
jgi:hypothetical protein